MENKSDVTTVFVDLLSALHLTYDDFKGWALAHPEEFYAFANACCGIQNYIKCSSEKDYSEKDYEVLTRVNKLLCDITEEVINEQLRLLHNDN